MPSASDSILNSVKKVLDISPSYDVFDLDITMHINSALSTLTQLGVGPEYGFTIDDADATWADFLTDPNKLKRFSEVRTYIYLRLRLIFDPPPNSFTLDAYKEQIKELEWRINVTRETTDWIDPNPILDRGVLVIDGGDDG